MVHRKVILPTIIFLFVSVINQSCIVYNSAKQEEQNNICSLHSIKMKKTIVKTRYGLNDFGMNSKFPNAKARKSMGCVVPAWPTGRLAIVYYCTRCDEMKKQADAAKKAASGN